MVVFSLSLSTITDCTAAEGAVSLLSDFDEQAAIEPISNAVIIIAAVLFNIVITSLVSSPKDLLRCVRVLFFVMSVLYSGNMEAIGNE